MGKNYGYADDADTLMGYISSIVAGSNTTHIEGQDHYVACGCALHALIKKTGAADIPNRENQVIEELIDRSLKGESFADAINGIYDGWLEKP